MITKPSFISLALNGILILFVLVLFFQNYNEYTQNHTQFLVVIILLSIMLGIHGLLHLGLEQAYNYNPLETGKLF